MYFRRGVRLTVISTCVVAEYPTGKGSGPQILLSVSRSGRRATDDDVAVALKAFDLTDGEEDNHHPGQVRNFWRPIDPEHRVACQCKSDEDIVVEPDGYTWTNPKTGACRGCEMVVLNAALGRPLGACPFHEVARG